MGEVQLLNIKQAAEFLNVSEISLRRWTNQGRLTCLRVGRRRERRFRRQDLLAFLEEQGPAAGGRALPSPDAVAVAGVPVELGSHICALYDSDVGRLRLAVPFLSEGLRQGDLCYLVARREAGDAIRKALPRDVPVTKLIVFGGAKTADAMYDYLERTFLAAESAGVRTIRLLGDMGWSLARRIPPADLITFEMRVDQSLVKHFPAVAVCQYDVREFAGHAVLGALRSHPDTFRHPLVRLLG
jgi:excisionase family DNA binding protein